MTSTPPRRLGVGLISAGWMGTVHSRGYRAVQEKYPDLGVRPDLVLAADPVAENARRLADQVGYHRTTTDPMAVLADPEVDVVSICAPNYLHRQYALAAAAAGKPFWIEKPMGVSAAQSQDIAEAVTDAGLVTAVGFNYRHVPAVARARQILRSGRLGTVTQVRIHLDADYSADPAGPRTWRYVRETAGTGVLGDLLSHGFDLAQWMVGPLAEVSAATSTIVTERPAPGDGVGHQVAGDLSGPMLPVENEDVAVVLARFADGAIGTVSGSRVAIGSRCDYGIQVQGTAGALRWDFERMNELEICTPDGDYGYTRVMTDATCGDFSRFQPGAGMGLSFDDLKTVEAAQFLRSVLTGDQTAPSVADGLAAARLVQAAADSAADGRWHPVPAPVGRTTYHL